VFILNLTDKARSLKHLIRFLKRLARNKKAFTGIEAAIVLIAFIVVAAAFSFVVLNMGFLAAQKSKSAVSESIDQISTTLAPVGGVYGESSDNISISTIKFYIRLAFRTDQGIDVNDIQVIYVHGNYNNITTATIENVEDSSDTIINWGETFRVTMPVPDTLRGGDTYEINVMPPRGAVITLKGIIPENVEPITWLG
jgi:flagellin FlaB